MIHRITAIAILLLATTPSLRADWKYSANRYDLRVATTTADGASPDGPVKTKLTIQYTPAKDGTMAVEFIVEGAAKMKEFGYAAFEGPDAVAAKAALARIVVERRGAKPLVLQTKVGGWYLDDAFHFAANETNAHPAELLQAVRAIQSGAAKVSVSVQDFKDAKKQVRADFATDGAADALTKLLK